MQEELVLFETAKLAKEKGFNISCLNWYHHHSKKLNTNDLMFSMNLLTNNYSAPTQGLLQKWLREVHNIHICGEVRWNNFKKKELIYEFWIKDMREVKPSTKIYTEPSILSYEEALEKGLYQALKLI